MPFEARSVERLPQRTWEDTLTRVRSEFDEMPCLRVTPAEARALFGLPGSTCEGVLRRLHEEGFLACTDGGAYMRNKAQP
jgi:hypothetical protein